ncbi:MAG: hypothetical protein FRX48_07253 [Lasallia pustulata]|uniref:LEA domain protein n=1 Tax=Lasallia pustulata TaxID=136370 RepID=A0A5M8PHN5_9LECA|nr:MAG: hypothetical protein FRX48_07253 [Lasallia pustulata]
MSFLYKISTRSARVARITPRLPLASRAPLSVSASLQPPNPVKDALKAVDRTVSDAAVKGIETGEQVSQATKEAVGINASKAAGAASETAGEATGTAKSMAGRAKGSAETMSGETEGSAKEMMGEAKGKAQEVAGQAKGKAAELKGEVKSKM